VGCRRHRHRVSVLQHLLKCRRELTWFRSPDQSARHTVGDNQPHGANVGSDCRHSGQLSFDENAGHSLGGTGQQDNVGRRPHIVERADHTEHSVTPSEQAVARFGDLI